MKSFYRFISRSFTAAVCVAAASISLSSCIFNINGITGNGNITTQTRTVGAFSAVSASWSGDVDVICKSTNAGTVEVSADENLMQYIRTEVVGGTLRIHTDNAWFTNSRRLYVRVNAAMIGQINNTGSGNATVTAVDTTAFDATVTGSGSLTATGSMRAASATVTGSGDMKLTGAAQTLNATISGSGGLDTRNLLAQQTSVRISGSGSARVYASQSLDGIVSGSGSIFYLGNPAAVRRTVSGSGVIVPGN